MQVLDRIALFAIIVAVAPPLLRFWAYCSFYVAWSYFVGLNVFVRGGGYNSWELLR